MIFLAIAVLSRSKTYDISLAFLFFYALLLFIRSLWYLEPIEIPIKQIQNGALLLFSFFMISDPKTIPTTFKSRIVFAFLCAALAFYLQYVLFVTYGIFYSLAIMTPLVFIFEFKLPKKFDDNKKIIEV
jgi:Na+-translocating ferredoxin:NAD+ oxidoreductase RnfD subunit